jgi:hypothetical protein
MSYDPAMLAAAAAVVVLLGVIVRLTQAMWASVMEADHLSLMTRMLARQGVEVSASSMLAAGAVGRAVLRCATCAETARCRRFLAADDGEGFDAFCPNTGFIRALKRDHFSA